MIIENKYGCYDQFRCETSLYILSMMANTYNVIIYHGVG